MTTIGIPPRSQDDWDRPASELESEAVRIWTERNRRVAVLTLRQAAAASHSPSDRIAYALDGWLVTHPDAPVSTDLDYPTWTPGGAS